MKLTPQEYELKRKKFLDKAYKAGSQGNRYKFIHYVNKVGELDAQYAEQCRRTLKEGTE